MKLLSPNAAAIYLAALAIAGVTANAADQSKDDVQDINAIISDKKPILDAGGDRDILKITLQDVIEKALIHNYDIRVESFGPSIGLNDVTEAEAVFDAVIFGSAQYSVTDAANLDTGYFNRNIEINGNVHTKKYPSDPFDYYHDYNYSVGVRKQLSTGAQIQLSQNLRRFQDLTDDGYLYYDPYYQFGLEIIFQQPLLRNFGVDLNRAAIRAARNRYRISRQEFQLQVINTMVNVETNYWRLFFSRQNYKIMSKLLTRAERTLKRVEKRSGYDSQSMAVSQVNRVIGETRARMVAARNNSLQLQDRLLNSINNPQWQIGRKWEIIPMDSPQDQFFDVDIDDALETAMELRPEIIAQRQGVELSNLQVGVSRNQTLPRLDLQVQQEITGPGTNLDDSWNSQWHGNTANTTIGISFEHPIASRKAKAALSSALKRKSQQELQMKGLRQDVLADVNMAVNNLTYIHQEIQARMKAVDAVRNELLNYLVMQNMDQRDSMNPNFLNRKLQADERMASNQVQAVQKMIEYDLAIMNLHRAQGTLQRYNNVKLVEAP